MKETLVAIAGILTTLAETDGGPESSCYLALGANLDKWETLKSIMMRAGWLEIKGNWCSLTAAGKAKAAEIEKALSK